MPKHVSGSVAQQRRNICEEAARLMLEHGLRDFQRAKEKACARFGIPMNQAWMPSNHEIEQALLIRQKLFHCDSAGKRVVVMLRLALELMQLLEQFRPRLAGALPRGHLTDRTPVELHLFSDEVESVSLQLDEHAIPYEYFDKRFRKRAGEYVYVPGFRFFADEVPVELLVFYCKGERQAPLCPVTGRPMARANMNKVRELLTEGIEVTL